VVLDGSVAAQSDNVLIYATSNRRHLMPEYMDENLDAKHQDDGEIHPGEGVEEKISLSERFGLWLSFYPFRQDDYLAIVYHWLTRIRTARPREIEVRARPTRCSGRCCAVRAAAAWPGSSRATTRDATRSETAMSRKIVDVAAAVITRPDGSFLLGQRAPGTFYPGYWEFPGGKVEPGETPREALIRELHEELGLNVDAAWPWIMREHEYEHAHVRLHFFTLVGRDHRPHPQRAVLAAHRDADGVADAAGQRPGAGVACPIP
jgi:mutator protein MutT